MSSEWSDGGAWFLIAAVLVIAAGLAFTLLPRLATFRTLVPRWRSSALVVAALIGVSLGFAAIRTGHVTSGILALSVAVGAALGALHLVVHCYRRAEEENERERRRSDSLFQGAPEAIVLVGLDRRLRRVNQAFTRLFGWTEEEVRGRLIDELVAPPEKLIEALEISRTVNAGGRVDLQTVRRRKDGSLVPVAVLVAPIWVRDELVAVYGIYLDISKSQEAERRLRENERMLELFFSQALDGLFIAMLDEPIDWAPLSAVERETTTMWALRHMRITKINDAMLAQYGATREEMVGRPILDFFVGNEAEGRENIHAMFTDGRRHSETHERRVDGTPLLIEGDYQLLRDDRGRILGHFGIQRDITDRRAADEELWASRRQLRELAARLQTIREEERSTLAREVHDEIGQLLTALKLELAWLRGHVSPRTPALEARLDSTLSLVTTGVESVRRIITSLRPALLDDLGLSAAIEWLARDVTERAGLTLRLDLAVEERLVRDDHAITIFRICQEALTNAVRHARGTEVVVRLWYGAGETGLEVTDNGVGLPALPSDRGRSGGLGLVGMRERAIACGGSLTIEGLPGGGTTVRVLVPVRRSAPYPLPAVPGASHGL